MKLPLNIVEDLLKQHIDKLTIKSRKPGKYRFNGRCPVCNEGSSKTKKRFFCLEDHDHWTVYCHNCDLNTSFEKFLENNYPDDYENIRAIYLKTYFEPKDKNVNTYVHKKLEPTEEIHYYLKGYFDKNCIPLTKPQSHEKLEKLRLYALKQMQKRLIPSRFIDEMFFCYKGHFNWRVIIPFINGRGLYYNFQARDIKPFPKNQDELTPDQKIDCQERKDKKYIFAQFDDFELPDDKIYNQYRVSKTRTLYICEGIIDSMFIDNSVALCNANVLSERAEILKEQYEDRVWVIDSPWTDKTGFQKICKLLEMNEKCFIMPRDIQFNNKRIKDINDLAIVQGVQNISHEFINTHIMKNGKLDIIKLKTLKGASK